MQGFSAAVISCKKVAEVHQIRCLSLLFFVLTDDMGSAFLWKYSLRFSSQVDDFILF